MDATKPIPPFSIRSDDAPESERGHKDRVHRYDRDDSNARSVTY